MRRRRFTCANNRRGQAAALTNLGATLAGAHRPVEAVGALREAIAIHRQTGEREGLAMATFSLASTLDESGRWFQALEAFEQARRMLEDLGEDQLAHQSAERVKALQHALPPDIPDESRTEYDERVSRLLESTKAGYRQYRTGDPVGALRYWEIALQDADYLQMKEQSSALLSDIGSVLCRLGRLREGVDCFRRAADRQRELGLGRLKPHRSTTSAALLRSGRATPRRGVPATCGRAPVGARERGRSCGKPCKSGCGTRARSDSAEALECLIRSRVIYEATGNRAAVETVAKLIPRVESNDRLDDRHAYGDPTNPTLPQTAEDFAETLRQAEEAESRHDFAEAARLYERMLGSRLYETSSIRRGIVYPPWLLLQPRRKGWRRPHILPDGSK